MKQLSTLLIAAILFTAITPTLKAQVNTQDSLALVDLYDSTGGLNWFEHNNWLTSAPVSSWFGITVSGGRVTGMILRSNSLKGAFPASFGNLYSLQHLDLNGNQFGALPPSMSNLTNLNYLSLVAIQLSHSIPSWIGNLTNLTYLNLSQNHLSSSIPSSIGSLINLKTLDLSSNQLSGAITTSLGNLTELTYLSLDGNGLSDTIPSSLGSLTNLYDLYLGLNKLSGTIPSSLGNLTNLKILYLDGNQLSGSIPSSLGNLSNLKALFLQNNEFTFDGMELIATKFPFAVYAPQALVKVSPFYATEVSVGGTPANNTYKWYYLQFINNDTTYSLVSTKVGDPNLNDSFIYYRSGYYFVTITNSVATKLTLNSDTVLLYLEPIKTINLQAKETNGQVLLQWQTIDEINTASFTIQHSADGVTFSGIGTKEAVGSGNNGYSFIDKSPAEGINYYRIKAVDKTGAITYSKVASLTIDDSRLTIFPNPVRDVAMIRGNHIANVQVIDNKGKLVKVIPLNDATNPTMSVTNLVAGVYYLHIKTTDGIERVVSFVKE